MIFQSILPHSSSTRVLLLASCYCVCLGSCISFCPPAVQMQKAVTAQLEMRRYHCLLLHSRSVRGTLRIQKGNSFSVSGPDSLSPLDMEAAARTPRMSQHDNRRRSPRDPGTVRDQFRASVRDAGPELIPHCTNCPSEQVKGSTRHGYNPDRSLLPQECRN